MIMQISKGDYTLLSRYADYLTAERGISYGMYFSVECGEDMAFTTMQDLNIAANALRPEIKSAILTSLQADFSVCQAWGQGAVPLAQKLPVISSIPTLILSGEYDPITPPSNGKLAMQTLSNSFFFLFPATGHGVFLTGSCPASITVAFLTNPLEKPGASCISTMQEPDFQPAIIPPVPT
jgi:pimeloyl-ACP methyl ester carboxylesterase